MDWRRDVAELFFFFLDEDQISQERMNKNG